MVFFAVRISKKCPSFMISVISVMLPSGKRFHNELENHHAFFMGKLTTFLWPCSMSQTVSHYQRVYPIKITIFVG